MARTTLLFVDDSATMRQIIEKTFAAEPIDVIAVSSGEAAIAKVREVLPSLIIADVGMPGMTGYDICKAVRSEPSTAQLPVVLMSGISVPYDEVRGREVGATEHLKKPFDTTTLIEQVANLTGAAQQLDPLSAPMPEKGGMTKTLSFNQPRPGSAGAPKSTKDFMQPNADMPKKPSLPRPNSIERNQNDETSSSGETVRVGTLAELAQMDEPGNLVEKESQSSSLELDVPGGFTPQVPDKPSILPQRPSMPVSAPAPVAPAPAPAASGPVPAPEKPVASVSEVQPDAQEVISKVGGELTSDQVKAIQRLTENVVEQVVWEVVPDLAEALIQERINQLLQK